MTDCSAWLVAKASVTGSSHEVAKGACQDAHRVETVQSDHGLVLIAVVSDGAGSARAADIGSQIAVHAVCEQAVAYFRGGGSTSALDRNQMSGWLAGVREQIADEAARTGGDLRDYACTLLITVIDSGHAAFAQLGDGAMVVLTPEKGWAWVFWPQHGEYANTTFFVTDDRALDQFEFECTRHRIDEMAMFTDGLEQLVLDFKSRTPHEPFFDRMFLPLRLANDGAGCDLSKHLENYLVSATVRERTDDDVTLVLARKVISGGARCAEPVHAGDESNAH